jgi:hypothetical protein
VPLRHAKRGVRPGLDAEVLAREASSRVMGAFVRARKPET